MVDIFKCDLTFLSAEDRALLEKEFTSDDPMQIEGLVDSLPEGLTEIPRILFSYDMTPPGGKNAGHLPNIPCAFPHSSLHWNGYVVEFDDGRCALIGTDCGKNHFGFDFEKLVSSKFEHQKERKGLIIELIKLREKLPRALDELVELTNMEAVHAYEKYFAVIRKKFGPLSQKLVYSVRTHQGALVAFQLVLDEEAMEKKALEKNKGRELYYAINEAETAEERQFAVEQLKSYLSKQDPIYIKQPLQTGHCAEWQLICSDRNLSPERYIIEATELAAVVAEQVGVRKSDEWENGELKSMKKSLNSVFEKVEAAGKLHARLSIFAGRRNMEAVATWANIYEKTEEEFNTSYSAVDGALVIEKNGDRLELSSDYNFPKTPVLDEVIKTLN